MEVKKSLWADMDGRQLSNNKHQHGRFTLEKRAGIPSLIINTKNSKPCDVSGSLLSLWPVFIDHSSAFLFTFVVPLQLNTERSCLHHLNLDNPATKLFNVCSQQIFQSRKIFLEACCMGELKQNYSRLTLHTSI